MALTLPGHDSWVQTSDNIGAIRALYAVIVSPSSYKTFIKDKNNLSSSS